MPDKLMGGSDRSVHDLAKSGLVQFPDRRAGGEYACGMDETVEITEFVGNVHEFLCHIGRGYISADAFGLDAELPAFVADL